MSTAAHLLELKAIDAGYGAFQALFGVNLHVNAGEAVGVIGPKWQNQILGVVQLIRPISRQN